MTFFLRVFTSCSLFFVSAAALAKPNVLFIATDDMNNWQGCYGDKAAKTPHLDSLAARGMRFDKAYCQFPLCSPSRTSIMTGRLPDSTGVYDLQTHFRKNLPDVVTLGQHFQKEGYHVARVGKIYHYGNPGDIGTPGLDDAPTWKQTINPRGIDKDEEDKLKRLTPKRGLGSSLTYYASPAADEEHTDGMVATEAIRILEEKKDEPFFLAVGFYRPHCPYIAPQKYFDLYPLDSIQLPVFNRQVSEGLPWQARASTGPWPNFGVDDTALREATRAYRASISFVDAQLGRVLAALDRLKLKENTHIVFWSDHGYHMGDHGLIFKMSLLENSARVPLLMAGPAVKKPGSVCGVPVELMDLYPTLVEVTGGKPSPTLEGVSLAPLLAGKGVERKRSALSQVTTRKAKADGNKGEMGYSLRSATHRYVRWAAQKEATAQATELLFDYAADPLEQKNLAQEPASQALLESFRKELTGRLKSTGH